MRVRKPPSDGAGRGVATRLDGWTEGNSEAFAALARIAVPARDEQIAILTDLVPARRDEGFTAVEVGAGQGALARAILSAFPRCRYVALDRSEHMLAALRRGLRAYGSRVMVRGFDLAAADWRRELPRPLRCVLASLVVHHLTDAQKRWLFKEVAARLDPGGACLLADLVAPANAAVQHLFAAQWNADARAQSLGIARGAGMLRRFRRAGWNHYATSAPDPDDRPARLLHQLQWLDDAGFDRVDCFWMRAGHAIFGGYVRPARGAGRGNGTRARRRV